jgi:threonine/homoserine/homoserine lactone efflux protein
MDAALLILAVAGVLLLGAISPGPSFVFVARTSVALSRADGVAAALGMGVGAVMLGVSALFGLFVLFQQADWLYWSFRLGGGAYLIYLAMRLWMGSATAIRLSQETRHGTTGLFRSFALALATQLSNPKAVVIYGGLFAALLPPHPTAWVYAALPPVILAVETGWYTTVAIAFSMERPRLAYVSSRRWIDRSAGAVLGWLGLRLILKSSP